MIGRGQGALDGGAAAAALGAAALFGASTPVARALVADVHPVVLAALLYLGSGIGLLAIRARAWLRPGGTGLARRDWPWLAAAIAFSAACSDRRCSCSASRARAARARRYCSTSRQC